MLHYLVYVASPRQIELVKKNLNRLRAPNDTSTEDHSFKIVHPYLGDLQLIVNLFTDIGQVSSHLKKNPIDLLIYDDRQGGLDAYLAIHKLESDLAALSQQWGPDFRLPKGRIIVLLEDSDEVATKSFRLGRLNVKDILVAPTNIAKTLRWIARVLKHDEAQRERKIGVACNGGGMEGFLFQAGCLHALNKALKKRSLHDCQVFSGVSSGSIHATVLASGIPTDEVIKSIKGESKKIPPLKSSIIYDFSATEIIKRFIKQAQEWGSLTPSSLGQKAMQFIPTGVLQGKGLKTYIQSTINSYGGLNDFRSLHSQLYIGTTHQDTFEHVIMGAPPWTHVPISDAIRASCAIPPFFTPHKIDNEYYMDGQISSPCDLEILIRGGCNLVFIIDPVVPFISSESGATDNAGGLHNLIQSIKTLINARFRSELSHSIERFPHVDFLVFQPYGECSSVMRGSPLKYKINKRITDLAYRSTLHRLRERYTMYQAKLIKYGFELVSPEELAELENEGSII